MQLKDMATQLIVVEGGANYIVALNAAKFVDEFASQVDKLLELLKEEEGVKGDLGKAKDVLETFQEYIKSCVDLIKLKPKLSTKFDNDSIAVKLKGDIFDIDGTKEQLHLHTDKIRDTIKLGRDFYDAYKAKLKSFTESPAVLSNLDMIISELNMLKAKNEAAAITSSDVFLVKSSEQAVVGDTVELDTSKQSANTRLTA